MNHEIIGRPVAMGDVVLPLSMAVRAGDFVYISGMVACDAEGTPDFRGDICEQTRLSLRAIESQLIEAGCTLADVVKATIYLKKKEDFAAFNATYAEFFPDAPPARTSVCADFVVDGPLIEIDVTAYRPKRLAGEA